MSTDELKEGWGIWAGGWARSATPRAPTQTTSRTVTECARTLAVSIDLPTGDVSTIRKLDRASFGLAGVGGGAGVFREDLGLLGGRYILNAGVDATIHSVTATQPMPPLTTDGTAPNAFATSPASSSPSCGPPMKKTMLTPVMRPRR